MNADKIAVIGAGAYGSALGEILSVKGYSVSYYDPKLRESDISKTLSGASYILLVVPSNTIEHVLPLLPKDLPLIIATKGILSCSVFDGFSDKMLISGPGFAKDIVLERKTKLTATDHRVIDLFSANYLSFDYTDDFNGVLMCGSLKNVYAIGAGLLGLDHGAPLWRKYITEVYRELKSILTLNASNPDTVDLACGVGDLMLTCDTPSRNYQFGVNLRDDPNYKTRDTLEGLSTIQSIKEGELEIPEDAAILKDIIKKVSNGTK
ncbi:hypothetical protein J5491_04100 [Candidatus Saccharibacteria bacterium]|nr:hypothetical protein [Candidatus Saccharibacteria bacterium]